MLLTICLALGLLSGASAFKPTHDVDPDVYQGDMRLTPIQRLLAETGGDVSLAGKFDKMFGSTKHQELMWLPNKVVPYDISADLASNPRATFAIMQGIREWETYSCLKFVERTTEIDYLYIFNNCSGCWSWVGRQGGKQEVCLDNGCHSRATVAHELAHAMGFWHEQSRPDRDQYIEVLWENIEKANAYNFDKHSNSDVDSLGTPYDHYSMMQYEGTSFSMNGNITMRAKQPEIFQLGNEVGFTKIDSVQAMRLYACNGTTTKKPFPENKVVLNGPNDCDFETGLCHFRQASGDEFDWTLRKGATASGGTGPSVDHTTHRMGSFLYMEASFPRSSGDKAKLVSKSLKGTKCMTIHYHMYSDTAADNIGTLNVYVKTLKSGLLTKLFTVSGSQGNEWQRKSLDISMKNKKTKYEIVFEGIRGQNYEGDIALDDISFTSGACQPNPSIAPPPSVPCEDTSDREGPYCQVWKNAGLCAAYKIDMMHICKKTCSLC